MDEYIIVEYHGTARTGTVPGPVKITIGEDRYVFGPKPLKGLPPWQCRVREAHFAVRIKHEPKKWAVISDPTPDTVPAETADEKFERYHELHAQFTAEGKLPKKLLGEYRDLASIYGDIEEQADDQQEGLE